MALHRNGAYLPLSYADETNIYSLLPALLIFTASENSELECSLKEFTQNLT